MQITKDGEKLKEKLDDGYTNYQYNLPGFDEKGNEVSSNTKDTPIGLILTYY